MTVLKAGVEVDVPTLLVMVAVVAVWAGPSQVVLFEEPGAGLGSKSGVGVGTEAFPRHL